MNPLKKFIPLATYLLCTGVLLAGTIYAHTKVRTLSKDVTARQAILQQIPAETIQKSILKKELDTALSSMGLIDKTVPTEDGLVGVITAISQAAIVSGISAQLPVVGAKIISKDAPSEDIFSDVRIHIIASGDPATLSSFLYRVEHLPYIIRIVFFKIDTIQQSSIASFAGPVQPGQQNLIPVLGSSLEAELAIVTKKKNISGTSPIL